MMVVKKFMVVEHDGAWFQIGGSTATLMSKSYTSVYLSVSRSGRKFQNNLSGKSGTWQISTAENEAN